MAEDQQSTPEDQTKKAVSDTKRTAGAVKTTVTTTRTAVRTAKAIGQAAKAVKTGVQVAATAAKATNPVGWAMLAAQYLPKIKKAVGNIIRKVAKIAAVTSAALILALGAKIVGALTGLAFGALTGAPLLLLGPPGVIAWGAWTLGWGAYGFMNPAGLPAAMSNVTTFVTNVGTAAKSVITGASSLPSAVGGAVQSAVSGIGNFVTGLAQTAWSGISGAVGGVISGTGGFFVGLSTLSLPFSSIAIPVFGAFGAITAGSLIVGTVTDTAFFNRLGDAPENNVPENEYASISKTASPTSMTNDEATAGRDVTYTITFRSKALPLTSVTITNSTSVNPSGSSSFAITKDKNGNDITRFDIGVMDPNTTRTFTYTIHVQGDQFKNSVITDTAKADFTADTTTSSVSASASVTVGNRPPLRTCGGLQIGFNTTGITHYGYGEPFPFSNFSDVDADLAAIRDIGGTVVRVFAANDGISNAEASRRLGVFLDKAETYNISVIVTFIDFYNSHFRPQGTEKYYTEFWSGGRLLGAEFYISGYKNEYLSFVQTLINDNKNRSNIYAWEVGNELKYDKNPSLFISFMQDITSIIKSLDSSHPISTGMINAGHTGLTPAELYPNLPDIDIISVHTYDGDRSSGTPDVDWANANGKRVINGEIGFAGGPGDDRSTKMDAELTYWKSKNASAILQWGFVAKGLGDNGNGDTINGMDTFFHTDYDQLANVFKNAVAPCVLFVPQGPWSASETASIGEVINTLNLSPKIMSLLQSAGIIYLVRVSDGSIPDACGYVDGANTVRIDCDLTNSALAKYVIIHELGHVIANYNGSVYSSFLGVYAVEGLVPTYTSAGGGPSESFAEMIADYVASKIYDFPPRSWSGYPGGVWVNPGPGWTTFQNDWPEHYNFAKSEIFGGVEY